MPEPNKRELERVLKSVIKGLDEMTANTEHTYYESLYEEGYSEAVLAEKAIRFPELHPLMVQLAEKIIEVMEFYGPLVVDTEEQGGSALTLELALHDKKYCHLFTECLGGQDLAHAVNQPDYTRYILSKWGLCDETAAMLVVWQEYGCVMGDELIADMLERYGEALQRYLGEQELEGPEGIADDDEDDDEDAEIDAGGYCLTMQDKRTLESVTVHWEKDYPNVAAMYTCIHPEYEYLEQQGRVFCYGSYAELEAAVADWQARCEPLGYAWEKEDEAPLAKALYRRWAGNPEAPRYAQQAEDVFDLFTPAGQPTPEEIDAEKRVEGKPRILCRKVLLYKAVNCCIFFFADLAGHRIYTPNVFDARYFWSFDSQQQTQEGLERLVQEYGAKGYLPVLEEDVQYAFEYSLQQSRDMLGDPE